MGVEAFGSREELASKIHWEGGVLDALEYGVHAEAMPDGDTELANAWAALDLAWEELQAPLERVYALLPDEE